ncbi:MAG: type II toxin-antitoxin system VapB family antitoxin [Jatrophihabitans sp.]
MVDTKAKGAVVAINIKNDETQRLARELAGLTGETVTSAVTVAVRERLERIRRDELTVEQRTDAILQLGRDMAARLGPNPLTTDDLYDDVTGLPA